MDILSFLELPQPCIYNAPLTKVFFKKNFVLTRVDKTFLEDPSLFQEMRMFGSIKPDNTNIPVYISDTETYEELVFIIVKTSVDSFDKYHVRIANFIQKYIPYHLVVCIEADDKSKFSLHLARKNVSKNNKNERVITESMATPILLPTDTEFLKYWSLSLLSKNDLRAAYNDYIALVYSIQITKYSGIFTSLTYSVATEAMIVLREIEDKEQILVNLRTQIKKEAQLNEQVKLNTLIHQQRQEINELKNKLSKIISITHG